MKFATEWNIQFMFQATNQLYITKTISYMRVIPVPARQQLTTIHEMNLQAIKRNIRNSGFTCPSWTCLPCVTKKDLHQANSSHLFQIATANSIGRTAGPCLRRWQRDSPATWRTTRVRLHGKTTRTRPSGAANSRATR